MSEKIFYRISSYLTKTNCYVKTNKNVSGLQKIAVAALRVQYSVPFFYYFQQWFARTINWCNLFLFFWWYETNKWEAKVIQRLRLQICQCIETFLNHNPSHKGQGKKRGVKWSSSARWSDKATTPRAPSFSKNLKEQKVVNQETKLLRTYQLNQI